MASWNICWWFSFQRLMGWLLCAIYSYDVHYGMIIFFSFPLLKMNPWRRRQYCPFKTITKVCELFPVVPWTWGLNENQQRQVRDTGIQDTGHWFFHDNVEIILGFCIDTKINTNTSPTFLVSFMKIKKSRDIILDAILSDHVNCDTGQVLVLITQRLKPLVLLSLFTANSLKECLFLYQMLNK